MRKPLPSLKLYAAPYGFERVALDRWHVKARTAKGDAITIRVDGTGHVQLNVGTDDGRECDYGGSLSPFEAQAVASALIEAARVADRFYIKPRVRVRQPEGIEQLPHGLDGIAK